MRAAFMEEAICQRQATLLAGGALAVRSNAEKSRFAPTFIVDDEKTADVIDWSEVHRPLEETEARDLLRDLQRHFATERTFAVHGYLGPFPVEFVTTSAWHAAFTEILLRDHFVETLANDAARAPNGFGTLRVWHDPFLQPADIDPRFASGALSLLSPSSFEIAILGHDFAGEIQKAFLQFAGLVLPLGGILTLPAGACCSQTGDNSMLLCGESGLVQEQLWLSRREVVATDALAWSERGVSNLEGGIYAKIGAAPKSFIEASRHFGALLENVEVDENRRDFNLSTVRLDEEPARATLELSSLGNAHVQFREVASPKTVVLLVSDATRALPPLARLSWDQAIYHFLVGDVSRARIKPRRGLTCLPLRASIYADLFRERLEQAHADVWLVNASAGRDLTSHILDLLQGDLAQTKMATHPIFKFEIPQALPGIEPELLKAGAGAEDLAHHYLRQQLATRDPKARQLLQRGGPEFSGSPERDPLVSTSRGVS